MVQTAICMYTQTSYVIPVISDNLLFIWVPQPPNKDHKSRRRKFSHVYDSVFKSFTNTAHVKILINVLGIVLSLDIVSLNSLIGSLGYVYEKQRQQYKKKTMSSENWYNDETLFGKTTYRKI